MGNSTKLISLENMLIILCITEGVIQSGNCRSDLTSTIAESTYLQYTFYLHNNITIIIITYKLGILDFVHLETGKSQTTTYV